VIEQKSVKQDFVGILQGAQINMALQVIILSLVGLISTNELLLNRLNLGR
jgi:hypothetical protein